MYLEPGQSEILKAKYLDHAEELRFRTNFDFKLLSGFVTLNLVLAAWLTQHPLATVWFKVGFAIFVFGISGVAVLLFQRNLRRRKVVVEIMHNLNDALGFDKDGVFRDKGPINPKSNLKTTYWTPWYRIAVLLFFLAQIFIIFGTPPSLKGKQEVKKTTEQGAAPDVNSAARLARTRE